MGHKIVSMQMDEALMETVDRLARDSKITRTNLVHQSLRHWIKLTHGDAELPSEELSSHDNEPKLRVDPSNPRHYLRPES